ncbi:MAG: asparagine synthase (glutamine-hydrolyzing), partial [Pseudomonadota bacterium]
ELGPDCLNLFEGMFALAVWDKRNRSLFAARDRFGKKPFYYTLQNGVLAFASELTAFLPLPFLKLELDRRNMARFLAYEHVPTPDSIYQNVYKLRPGHYLTYHQGSLATNRYWDLPVPALRTEMKEPEIKERLLFLASRAVKRRLVSDVPLGVFLSGGLDSSAVVALMSEHLSGREIKTFNIGFEEAGYDESPYARLVARTFGTDHHEEILSAAGAGELLPEIVQRLDEPLADPSVVPTYLLSRLTRRSVTVALGGDGGDELFAGYGFFPGFLLSENFLRLPQWLRGHIIAPLAGRLPLSFWHTNPRHEAVKFISIMQKPRWLRTQMWLGAFRPEALAGLLLHPPFSAEDIDGLYASTKDLYSGFPASRPRDRVLYLTARQFLLDFVMVKVDRCSMMHSLEVRAPFLDRDLVEFAFALPVSLKLRYFRRKYILKKALRHLLPDRIIRRKKKGFLIPTGLWLKGALKPMAEEFFDPGFLKRQGLFRPEMVQRLLEEHNRGWADNWRELWTLLVLQLWLSQHRPAIV